MFLMIFCLLFVSTTAVCWMTPVTAEAASVKQGLVKENGKYYYYAVNKAGKSVKVTEKWKTVKVTKNGKTSYSRYYFGKNGAAYAGSEKLGVKTPAVKKIDGKYYGFGVDAKMLKGTYFINEKFYVFSSNGTFDSARRSSLRRAYGWQWKRISDLLSEFRIKYRQKCKRSRSHFKCFEQLRRRKPERIKQRFRKMKENNCKINQTIKMMKKKYYGF